MHIEVFGSLIEYIFLGTMTSLYIRSPHLVNYFKINEYNVLDSSRMYRRTDLDASLVIQSHQDVATFRYGNQ